MKVLVIFMLIAFAASAEVHADAEKKDPIDVALDKATEIDPSTAGVVQATTDADGKWLKEIDRALSHLKKVMTAGQWKKLQVSQGAWKTFRDKELAMQDAIFESKQGSMWVPVAATSGMELDRERALLLRHYVDLVSEE